MSVWVHARCDGELNGWVSTVDRLQVDCMMGMHLPLSMRRSAAGQEGKGREEGENQARHRSVGVRYLSWLRQDLQDKRLEAAVPTAW